MTETRDFDPGEVRRSDHSSLVHQHLDWGAVRADIVKRTGLARQETNVSAEQHSFIVNLQGEARAGEDFVEGRRVAFTPRRPGSVAFLPARSKWSGWDEGDTTGSYLFVSIDTAFIDRAIGAENVTCLRPAIGFRDTVIEACLQRIAAELKNPDPISVVMVESQAILLFVQMVRLNGLGNEPAKGGLSPFDLKRVVAIIENRLGNPPNLDEMAGEIGVSRRHFFRAFKQSTGKSPHSFVTTRRLERSVDLLRTTELSATEVAFECGFASSSHFTYAFKRVYGTGPLEFRRRWRS